MTGKQSFLKKLYPLLMKVTNLFGANNKVLDNNKHVAPPQSLYDLAATQNNGQAVALSNFKGKKILFVNTASNCGYTGQYAELQQLHERFPQLVILGFPANDFKEQEKGSDAEIAEFCKVNYGVTFPIMQKSSVIRSAEQNKVFDWLSSAAKNGWNDQQPEWNFSKYLTDEQGNLLHYFGPSVSPLSKEITEAINI
ncbi:MAG: glutathione peroxidase [Filimonas sp.]|nr:glutathione peroxidase [Filimonas sp.]